MVSFARSGLNVRWAPAFQSLLELAEACDVPVRWACRTGVCHICEAGLINGAVAYRPEPVEPGGTFMCYRFTARSDGQKPGQTTNRAKVSRIGSGTVKGR